MDIFSQSEQLRQALTPFIQKIVDERTRDCLRTYKAKVVTAPNAATGKCVVQLMGQGGLENPTTLSLPYSTAVSSVSVGDMVWVATTYNSWRNAVVWEEIKYESLTVKKKQDVFSPAFPNDGDLNDFTPKKYPYTNTVYAYSGLKNAPETSGYFVVEYKTYANSADHIMQVCYEMIRNTIYTRSKYEGGEWTEWKALS